MAKSNHTPAAGDRTPPDLKTVEDRVEEQRSRLYQIEGLLRLAEHELSRKGDADSESVVSVARELLGSANGALDSVYLFAPAESQEVSHG